jgi:hypothetical protein
MSGNNVQLFIATYIKAFQNRYGAQARPDVGGKVQGQIKTLLKDISIERACALAQVYLQMDNAWFKTKGYDIGTFMQNINPISIALDTGSEQDQKVDFSWLRDELNKKKEIPHG